MHNRKTTFWPIANIWVNQQERWLTKQSEAGWIIEKIDWIGFHFVKKTPRERTFIICKTWGYHARFDHDIGGNRLGIEITSAFPSTNTFSVGRRWWWKLVSFKVDDEEKYAELLQKRNSYLIMDTIGKIKLLLLFLSLLLWLCILQPHYLFSLFSWAMLFLLGIHLAVCFILIDKNQISLDYLNKNRPIVWNRNLLQIRDDAFGYSCIIAKIMLLTIGALAGLLLQSIDCSNQWIQLVVYATGILSFLCCSIGVFLCFIEVLLIRSIRSKPKRSSST